MRRTLSLGLVALTLVLLFWKIRLTDPPAVYRATSGDLYTQLYPMWFRAAEWMREGTLPLWNPFQAGGHPFLAAALYGVLYPPNLVRLVLPVEVAFEVNIVVHLWLGLMFMYLYGRTIGLGRPGAFVAGAVYALSGAAAHEASWFTATIAAMVWLPLGFAALERVMTTRGVRARAWTAALAVSVAMPILAGWLQIWVYNAWATGAYAACHVFARLRRDRRGTWGGGALAAIGIALGLGLAAAQLLPSLELQSLGPRRAGGLSLEQVFPMAMPSPELILSRAVDAAPGPPRWSYVGIVALLLVPLAFLSPRGRRRTAFLAAMAVGSLLVSFSLHTPAYELSRLLPGGSSFRAPWRILCLYAFAMAALAGIAFDALSRRHIVGRATTWATIVMGALGLLLVAGTAGLAAVYVGVGAVLLLVSSSRAAERVRRPMRASLALVLVVDLFVANRNAFLRPFQDPQRLTEGGGVFEYIRAHQGLDRTYVTHPWPIPPPEWAHKQGTLRGVYAVTDYEVLSLERTARFYRALGGRFAPPGNHPFTGDLALDTIRLKQLTAMSVRFVVMHRGNPLDETLMMAGWAPVFTAVSRWVVYENPRVVPRAYLAYDARVAPDEETALTMMQRLLFDPHQFVVLESAGGDAPVALPSRIPIAAADIVAYEPTRVEIWARARAPAYLVLTDTWYPGWTAEVDGRPAEIVRANYMFRAVALEPGEHRVTFVYGPASFRRGALLSILSALALLVLLVRLPTRTGVRPRMTQGSLVAERPSGPPSLLSVPGGAQDDTSMPSAGGRGSAEARAEGVLARIRGILLATVLRVLLVVMGVATATGLALVASLFLLPSSAPLPVGPALEGLPVLTTIDQIARPNVRGVFSGALYETNSRGFRGPRSSPASRPYRACRARKLGRPYGSS